MCRFLRLGVAAVAVIAVGCAGVVGAGIVGAGIDAAGIMAAWVAAVVVVVTVRRAIVAVGGWDVAAVAVIATSVTFPAKWTVLWADRDVRMKKRNVSLKTSRTGRQSLTELRVMQISTSMANSFGSQVFKSFRRWEMRQ